MQIAAAEPSFAPILATVDINKRTKAVEDSGISKNIKKILISWNRPAVGRDQFPLTTGEGKIERLSESEGYVCRNFIGGFKNNCRTSHLDNRSWGVTNVLGNKNWSDRFSLGEIGKAAAIKLKISHDNFWSASDIKFFSGEPEGFVSDKPQSSGENGHYNRCDGGKQLTVCVNGHSLAHEEGARLFKEVGIIVFSIICGAVGLALAVRR